MDNNELTENEIAVQEYEEARNEFFAYQNNGYFYSPAAERQNKAYARLWELGILPVEP